MKAFYNFGDLIERTGGHVIVACDTEFKGPHTLTIQFAARVGDDIVVQVYSSPGVPRLPSPRKLLHLVEPVLKAAGVRVVIRPGKPITADLTPVQVLAEVEEVGDADPPQDVYFPLGLERHRVKVYRAMKSSAFVSSGWMAGTSGCRRCLPPAEEWERLKRRRTGAHELDGPHQRPRLRWSGWGLTRHRLRHVRSVRSDLPRLTARVARHAGPAGGSQ